MGAEGREAEARQTHFKVGFKQTDCGEVQGKGGSCLDEAKVLRG